VSRRVNGRQVGGRKLIEEQELIDGFIARGFTVIEPADMSVTRQIASFVNADIVAGLGGSGMFNTVFCKPGTRVIDLESSDAYLAAHSNLFSSAGLDYSIITGREDPNDPNMYRKGWSIGVENTLRVVDQLM
jgi:capsular polysaccharide biosynthesis protein